MLPCQKYPSDFDSITVENCPCDMENDQFMPRENRDMEINLSTISNGYFTNYYKTFTLDPLLVCIKEYEFFKINQSTFKNLRNLKKHSNIQKFLYILSDEVYKNLFMCFINYKDLECLKLVIDKNKPDNYQILKCLIGLVRGCLYLHDNCNLFYLNWTANSIKISQNFDNACLSDLSLTYQAQEISIKDAENSSNEESVDEIFKENIDDIDIHKPNYLPPEIFSYNYGRFIDTWGIGCLAFHLINGKPLFHKYRHNLDSMKELIMEIDFNSFLDSLNIGFPF